MNSHIVFPDRISTVAADTLATTHYENFPVGSWLLPKRYRKPIHRIYAFARIADDIADEGTLNEDERLRRLKEWNGELHHAIESQSDVPFFTDLASIIAEYKLPVELFDDLISAFSMDAKNTRYGSFDELLFYCRHSANPIGRLLLHLFQSADPDTCTFSDALCTALQLTNFWQDISVDTDRNRFYIPMDELHSAGLTVDDLRLKRADDRFTRLLRFQVERTRRLFLAGQPLIGRVEKRLRYEVAMTWHGGMRILEKIERRGYRTLDHRPALNVWDTVILLIRSARKS